MGNRYSKTPKQIRYDDGVLELAEEYCRKNNMTFSTLARVSLQSFLKRKIEGKDVW